MTPPMSTPIVFDLGMYDAADTIYYLETGHRVIAVEANPALALRGQRQLAGAIAEGRLTIINKAVSHEPEVCLTINGDNLGGSSTVCDTVAVPLATVAVPGVTLQSLIDEFGVPKFLKIDIEGADEFCVRSLNPMNRPEFLSFEIGGDFQGLVRHLEEIGYSRFKVIDQTCFRQVGRTSWSDRVALKLARMAGFIEPRCVRRNGRWFNLGHSSGPLPWQSDGAWTNASESLRGWKEAQQTTRNVWFDLHATI
jgi:FkbM family methyltransferase